MAEVYFWDASALVKVFVSNEKNHQLAQSLFNPVESVNLTNTFVFYESLGVIKRKAGGKKINEQAYQNICERLFDSVSLGKLKVYEIKIQFPDQLLAIRDIRKVYPRLDYSDAIQLLALNKTIKMPLPVFYKQFLTADNSLAEAAQKEGIEVINLNDEL